MKKQNKIIGGLRETPQDNRDFQVGALFRLPSIEEIPDNFSLEGYRIKDQQDTDYCSAYMATGMSSLQEGVDLWPDWSFACSKELTGDNEEWGQTYMTVDMPREDVEYMIEKGIKVGDNWIIQFLKLIFKL